VNNSDSHFLREDYNIETPENVTFGYEVADIGIRFIALLLDTIIQAAALAVVTLVILLLAGLVAVRDMTGPVLAVWVLLVFIVFWGYFILFELLWNGQTPGKRATRIRVVRTDGNPAGPFEIVVRELVRIVDFLPSGYALGVVVMFLNRRARRLGDFAAGTLVVKERRDVALESLQQADQRASLAPATRYPVSTGFPATPAPDELSRAEALRLQYPGINRLSAADYSLIQDALERDRQHGVETALLRRLAAAIAARLDCPPPPGGQARQFLEDVALLYRRYGQ